MNTGGQFDAGAAGSDLSGGGENIVGGGTVTENVSLDFSVNDAQWKLGIDYGDAGTGRPLKIARTSDFGPTTDVITCKDDRTLQFAGYGEGVLSTDANGNLTVGNGSGTGNIVTMTNTNDLDNAIVRLDGTSGRFVQSSVAKLNDAGQLLLSDVRVTNNFQGGTYNNAAASAGITIANTAAGGIAFTGTDYDTAGILRTSATGDVTTSTVNVTDDGVLTLPTLTTLPATSDDGGVCYQNNTLYYRDNNTWKEIQKVPDGGQIRTAGPQTVTSNVTANAYDPLPLSNFHNVKGTSQSGTDGIQVSMNSTYKVSCVVHCRNDDNKQQTVTVRVTKNGISVAGTEQTVTDLPADEYNSFVTETYETVSANDIFRVELACANTSKSFTIQYASLVLECVCAVPSVPTGPATVTLTNVTSPLYTEVTATITAVPSNFPAVDTLSYEWTKESGPGVVTFGTPTSVSTTISVNDPGGYVVRCTVTGDLSGTTVIADSNTITVALAPTVTILNVPSPLYAETTSAALIAGTSNFPTVDNLSYEWTKESGPGVVTFGTPTSVSTTISVNDPGDYVIRCEVTGDLSGSSAIGDSSTITVAPAPTVTITNVTSPIDTGTTAAAMTAVVSNFPESLSYEWTKESGPGVVTFGTPTSASTIYSMDQPGDYVIRCEVTGDLSGTTAIGNTSIESIPAIVPTVTLTNVTSPLPTEVTETITAVPTNFPAGESLSYQWTKESGPFEAGVTFGTPLAASTTYSMTQTGQYVIRCTVTSASATASGDSSTIDVVANAPPITTNLNSRVDPSIPSSLTLSGNNVINAADIAPLGQGVTYSVTVRSGSGLPLQTLGNKNWFDFQGGIELKTQANISTAAPDNFTLFQVLRVDSVTTNSGVSFFYGEDGTGNSFSLWPAQPSGPQNLIGGDGFRSWPTNILADTTYVMTVVKNGGNALLRINGTVIASAQCESNPLTALFCIGGDPGNGVAANGFEGNIGETLVYNTTNFTTAQLQTIEAYLTAKWT